MSVKTVAILEPGYADYRAEEEILGTLNARIVPVAARDDAVSSLRELDPVAVMVRERAITSSEIDVCPNLKIIVRYGVGVDNIDLETARHRGVYVANVPDYGAEHEVSEHAVALYLAVQRRIPTRDNLVRDGQWGIGQNAMIPNRHKAVLGLIGCGRIGLFAARKFRALGFETVLVFDPFLDPDAARDADLTLVDLDTLCQQADVISLHAPLTEDTHHILDARRIAQMKPTSILVNVSRGGLVDEHALARALQEGNLFGAGVDVFETEPLDQENPLLTTPNTVLSDHTAWYSERSVSVLQNNAAAEISRVLMGEPPLHWVNRW